MQSKNAIGNLVNRYRAVIKKCNVLNVFGTLAIACVVLAGGVNTANARTLQEIGGTPSLDEIADVSIDTSIDDNDTTVKGLKNISSPASIPTVTFTNWSLTLIGGTNSSFDLDENGDINITLATAGGTPSLVLGNDETTGSPQTYGTLSGTIDLGSSGSLKVYNGDFTVAEVTNSDSSTLEIANGTLTVQNESDFETGKTTLTDSTLNVSKNLTLAGTDNQLNKSSLIVGGMGTATAGSITLADTSFMQIKNATNASKTLVKMDNASNSIVSIGTLDKEAINAKLKAIKDSASNFTPTATLAVNTQTTNLGINVGGTGNATTGEINVEADALFIAEATEGEYLLTDGELNLKDGSGLLIVIEKSVDGELIGDVGVGDEFLIAKGGTGDATVTVNLGGLGFVGASGSLLHDVDLNKDNNGLKATVKVATDEVIATVFDNVLSNEVFEVVAGFAANNRINYVEGLGGAKFLSRVASSNFVDSNAERGNAVQSAASVTVAAATPQTGMAIATGSATIATGRTSLTSPAGSGGASSASNAGAGSDYAAISMNDGTVQVSGMSGEDGMANGIGLWFMPMYNNQQGYGYKSGGLDSGYNASFGGAVIGADYTINNALRFGMNLSIGGGNSTSTGDVNKTTNIFNYWGLGLYAGYVANNFGITADLGYTNNNSDVDQFQTAGLGGSLEGNIKSYNLSAGLRAEYKFVTDVIDIIPHIGVRVTAMHTNSYDMTNQLGVVVQADELDATIWTFPVGVTFAKDFETSNGWKVQPQLDLNVTPAAGDVEVNQSVRFSGVNAVSEMKSNVLDYLTYGGGLGVSLAKGNVSFGVNYNLQMSEHLTDHGVSAMFRYEF